MSLKDLFKQSIEDEPLPVIHNADGVIRLDQEGKIRKHIARFTRALEQCDKGDPAKTEARKHELARWKAYYENQLEALHSLKGM